MGRYGEWVCNISTCCNWTVDVQRLVMLSHPARDWIQRTPSCQLTRFVHARLLGANKNDGNGNAISPQNTQWQEFHENINSWHTFSMISIPHAAQGVWTQLLKFNRKPNGASWWATSKWKHFTMTVRSTCGSSAWNWAMAPMQEMQGTWSTRRRMCPWIEPILAEVSWSL